MQPPVNQGISNATTNFVKLEPRAFVHIDSFAAGSFAYIYL